MDQKSEEVPSEQLEGFVYAEHLNWWEVAHADEALFTSGLRDLGLPDGEIAEAWSVFSQTYRPLAKVDSEIDELNERYRGISFATAPADLVRLYEKRQGIVTRLNDRFKKRTIRINRTTQSKIRVPLFIISAPAVEDCSTSFTASGQFTRNLDCQVEIYGSGIGGITKASCQAQCTFTVNAGNAKVVFLPAELTVGEVSVLAKGKVIGQVSQVEAIDFPDSEPAVALILAGDFPSTGSRITTYQLAGDITGDVSTYSYDYKQSNTLGFSLKVPVFGVDVGLKAQVVLESEIGLTYSLKGGRDYSLHYLQEGQGITWSVSG